MVSVPTVVVKNGEIYLLKKVAKRLTIPVFLGKVSP